MIQWLFLGELVLFNYIFANFVPLLWQYCTAAQLLIATFFNVKPT